MEYSTTGKYWFHNNIRNEVTVVVIHFKIRSIKIYYKPIWYCVYVSITNHHKYILQCILQFLVQLCMRFRNTSPFFFHVDVCQGHGEYTNASAYAPFYIAINFLKNIVFSRSTTNNLCVTNLIS